MELACEADTAVDQTTVATELRGQAGDATLSAATIKRRRRTAPTALNGRPCQRAAVESTLRQICARSLACFDRGRALAQACKGDKALVGNAGFRRCLKTVGGERFALIPTRSSRRGSSTASLCCTQHRPQPLEVMLCCKTLWMVEQAFRTAAKHPSSTRPIFHNNQPVVGVDRDLNVVADVDLRMRGRTQAAGIAL
jgi:hypothetical protein